MSNPEIEIFVQNFVMEKVFNERPNKRDDWMNYMNAEEDTPQIEDFVPCEEYGFSSVRDIQGLLCTKVEEHLELYSQIKIIEHQQRTAGQVEKGIFVLRDELSGIECKMEVDSFGDKLKISPEGYATKSGHAPIELDFYKEYEQHLNVSVYSDITKKDRTDHISLYGAEIWRPQKIIEGMGFRFGKMKNIQPVLDEYFTYLEESNSANSNQEFLDFVSLNTEWNLCDCCNKIEFSENLHWLDDHLYFTESEETMNLLTQVSEFQAVCSDCLLELEKAYMPQLKEIKANLEKYNTPFDKGDVVLAQDLAGVITGTPFAIQDIKQDEDGKIYYHAVDQFDNSMKLPLDKVWNPTDYALVREYCNFVIGINEKLTEKLDEFCEITHEGIPELNTAFDTFGYKDDFKSYLATHGYEMFVETAFGVSMKLNKIESGYKTGYKSVITDTIEISAPSKNELFALYFKKYDNCYKYCNDLNYIIADEALRKEFGVWISDIGNYARNGGDMW